MIEFQNVSKWFEVEEQKVSAINEVSFSVPQGSIFGVVGESGAGKSTLLRCINALEVPSSGKVLINGRCIHELPQDELRKARTKIGCVFQGFNLLSSYTVFENIAFPLRLEGTLEKEDIHKRVSELIDFVGLSDKSTMYPSQLSGGQKQRVAIARALAPNPNILLCDEPTSALDPQTTKRILELISKLHKEFQITIFIISHEMSTIRSICDEIALMENGKVIEKVGTKEFFDNTTSQAAKNFLLHSSDGVSP